MHKQQNRYSNAQSSCGLDSHGGSDGSIEIPIQITIEVDSSMQISAIDFDSVLVC